MMLKSLQRRAKSFLNIFNRFKKSQEIPVPNIIESEEKIVRSIFSPVNVTNNNKLRTNAFKSPGGIDEVSVNRLDFTTPHFCKGLSKKNENPKSKRAYFGLALLKAFEIRDSEAEVISSPILDKADNYNPFHSDITVGYVKEKGEQLPAEINYKITLLTNKARFYKDPNPEHTEWSGDDLE